MRIDQLLYGYRNGHRLLAGSIKLSESLTWDLAYATDRPIVSEKELEAGVTFGYTLDDKYYALCRTWAAKEINRPGAVWTHVLLLPKQVASPLECLPLLHHSCQPDEEQFYKPKEYVRETDLTENPAPMTIEIANLILLLAARPNAALQAWSQLPPIELLEAIQSNWSGVLNNQPFATSVGHKTITAAKKAVIISAQDLAQTEFVNGTYLSNVNILMPSKRITRSWEMLGRDTKALQEWLSRTGSCIKQSSLNLKLVLELLLLGRGELDDKKLLNRISTATDENNENVTVLYCLFGQYSAFEFVPPLWGAALFFMGEENWSDWNDMVDARYVGRLAAIAPIKMLAKRLVNLAQGDGVSQALDELSKIIKPDVFDALRNLSKTAAGVLIERNPKLGKL